MVRKKSVVVTANEKVPFATAAGWLGLGSAVRDRGMKVDCPACGERAAMRLYPDHGYCHSECRYYSAVSLLAKKWQMTREDAAITALKKLDYEPAGYADAWAYVTRDPEPARDDLATALRTWCEANCPGWRTRQYDPAVADKLSRCLGLLPKVHTEDECGKWLSVCKEVMRRVLGLDLAKGLDSG